MENVLAESQIDLEKLKDYINENDIRIVLFAETHGLIDESSFQEKIISIVEPDYFLYELLEEEEIFSDKEFEDFLNTSDEEDFSIISKFGELKPSVKIAKKFNIPIIGCDIKNMLRTDMKFREMINPTKEDLEKEEEVMKKRESRQLSILEKYLAKKFDAVVFMSVGIYHLRKDSNLIKGLNENYVLVKPLFDGKEIDEVEDPTNCEITYLVLNCHDK